MKRIALFAALVFGVTITAAAAEPVFTINVPVNFQSIRPEVQFISVSCRLSALDAVTNKVQPFGPQLKYKNLKPDASGNYSGTVQLVWDRSEFNTNEQASFPNVHHVDCSFGLMINDTTYTANFPGAGVQVQSKPGTPFTDKVSLNF